MAIVVVVTGCSREPATADGGPRIAFLFDGSWDEADEVVGPALAGLRFAALGTGDPETIVPVNLGDDGAIDLLGEALADRAVVAAVVAPWTPASAPAVDLLRRSGSAVVSLGWAWEPAGDAPWIALAPDLAEEAELLVRAGAPAAELPSRRCVAGDTHPTSGRLSEAVVVEADRTGDPAADVGAVDPERPATAGAVAGRLGSAACRVVLWTGGTDALDLLLAAAPEVRTVVGSSRIKTEGGIAVGVTHPARRIVAVCACADVTLSDDPIQQRFIHDYQTESGSAPGPFSVEAYDAGRWLLRAAAEGARGPVAETVRRAGAVEGLLGTYRLDSDGALVSSPAAAGTWRAFGSRWLPLDPGSVPPLASALPLAGVLARVRPRKRPWAPTIHRSGEGT